MQGPLKREVKLIVEKCNAKAVEPFLVVFDSVEVQDVQVEYLHYQGYCQYQRVWGSETENTRDGDIG